MSPSENLPENGQMTLTEVIRNFDKCETQPLIDKIKQVENQWRSIGNVEHGGAGEVSEI